MEQLKVLAISGSLRKDSFNRKLLQIAQKISAELDAETAEADLKELALPIYDGDIESQGIPESVTKLKQMVESADVLLIASPEYNYSVSGALKNAIDWLSRGGNNSLNGKVAAIFGASLGPFGTLRGQYHLRQILMALNVFILPQPAVYIGNASESFNSDGTIKDPKSVEILKKLIEATFNFCLKLKS